MTGEFQRYLRAKRTIDDRALDRRLLDTLQEELSRSTDDEPLRVLEVGAGIGTMVTRFIEWDVFPETDVQYTAVDLDAENIAALGDYIEEWGSTRDVSVTETDTGRCSIDGGTRHIELEPVVAEATAFAEQSGGYDLLVGAALLDLLDVTDLQSLLTALGLGGVFYFPLTFDGGTRFLPMHPDDRAVERHYHDHMDAKPGGSSRAGGEVLARLQGCDGLTVDAAGSDWVVTPDDGEYPADEGFFLRYILDTVEDAVTEITAGDFDPLDDWLARRRAQVDAGELCYLTHQLDVLGHVDDPVALDHME